jgi:hypothetical protein
LWMIFGEAYKGIAYFTLFLQGKALLLGLVISRAWVK